jgi:MFS transporter, NRE family, putaive nickel resistance protein
VLKSLAAPPSLWQSLRSPLFARLYLAQTISLLGDALTWVGLALLAYELAGQQAATILSTALTLRVITFVVVAPWAGMLADSLPRKLILGTAHLARMGLIALLPWVSQVWQLYSLIVGLNIFSALFTPTFKATIPLVTAPEDYPQAIALTSATGQLLGILGPGLAGGLAAWLGLDQVFWLDALSFLIAALWILTLPGQLNPSQPDPSQAKPTEQQEQPDQPTLSVWQNLTVGTTQLFQHPSLRYALGMQLVAAIIGAQILVNTVGYIEGYLHQSQVQYGWVMAAFGSGAMLTALLLGQWRPQPSTYLHLIFIGALILTLALLPAQVAGVYALMGLWLVAGAGESLVNVPTQTLLADLIAPNLQGRVYGAHFAWSHLWWVMAYPLAGWLGQQGSANIATPPRFLVGGLLGLGMLGIAQLGLNPKFNTTSTPENPPQTEA